MIGLITNWFIGVILFFSLWALIMHLVKAYSLKHNKDNPEAETENDETTENTKEGLKKEAKTEP